VLERTLKRLAIEEEGFTLLELMIAMQIVVILLLIAVPSYLQFRDSANQATAKSNAKEAAFAAGLYYQSNSTYAGMTIPLLKGWDASLTTTRTFVNNSGVEATGVTRRVTLDASHYCTYATSGRWFAYQLNPTGAITTTTVGSAVCS
jgi:prepilin-type N-terminal cleavage/methylation domain-containing protein